MKIKYLIPMANNELPIIKYTYTRRTNRREDSYRTSHTSIQRRGSRTSSLNMMKVVYIAANLLLSLSPPSHPRNTLHSKRRQLTTNLLHYIVFSVRSDLSVLAFSHFFHSGDNVNQTTGHIQPSTANPSSKKTNISSCSISSSTT